MRLKINGLEISSPYGAMESFRNSPHTGIDIPLNEGTLLETIQDGVVSQVFDGSTSIGKGVAIKTDEGLTQIYGHMNQVDVEPGQILNTGDVIGTSGNTGFSTGPHLHFAVQSTDGTYVDPTPLTSALGPMINDTGGNWFVEKWNSLGDLVIGGQVKFILAPIGSFLKDVVFAGAHWVVANLPDILGYGAIATGVIVILSAMCGKGILKPIGWYSGALIAGLCILGGVN